ncbi:MAG: hypothetical protein L0387_01630, partial [Acidobacteria bacterium]|nr:hypothetical protein [Acidobacteriota bacterium]MCI0724124.1 hypothetical protein [Acidobacteriota bacterium]
SERPLAAPRRAGRPRSQGGCVKRTLPVESVRSASETLVWLRLYTDRAHNNRKAVRKTGKNAQSPDARASGHPASALPLLQGFRDSGFPLSRE